MRNSSGRNILRRKKFWGEKINKNLFHQLVDVEEISGEKNNFRINNFHVWGKKIIRKPSQIFFFSCVKLEWTKNF